jgi:hypothetical protein
LERSRPHCSRVTAAASTGIQAANWDGRHRRPAPAVAAPTQLVTARTTNTGILLLVRSRSARVTVIVRAIDILGNRGPARRTSN